MSVLVVVTPEAERQILALDAWWRANRTAAPGLFTEELAAAFEILAEAPQIGRRFRHSTISDVRRILLRTTRNHIYYKIHKGSAVVLAVWSAVRGTGPGLADSK